MRVVDKNFDDLRLDQGLSIPERFPSVPVVLKVAAPRFFDSLEFFHA
jgi:hypothetical protein